MPPFRLVIVGGVAGGASAAARARRMSEDATIVMFERGAHVSFANCGLPYHIGGTIKDRDRLLVQTPESLRERFNIDVRVRTEVTRIDRAARTIAAHELDSGREYTEQYDALILSPGAEPVRPPLPGIESKRVMALRSIADMDAIKDEVDGGALQHAVVVGGGYIGLEMAEALRARNVGVTLVEMLPQVMGPVDIEIAGALHQEIRKHGVDLRLEITVKAFEERNGRLAVSLGSGYPVECDLAILAIGVKPETSLARAAGLAIGDRGGIVVDEHMRTSDPHIFAAGDAIEVTDFTGGFKTLIPLAGPANRQGRIAADTALGHARSYSGTQGTGICKVFGLAVAMTGLNEKTLARLKRPFESVTVHAASHASYYPGAHPITLKLLFEPRSGKLLGAQALGVEGVDKRIDVIATAQRAGMTVFDLEDLELCYAPPYGSAKDPVNYLGFAAANVLRGDVAVCHAADVAAPAATQMLLDVRTPTEFKMGSIPGAVNIPIDSLRARLAELPRDKELLVFCQAGLRGYIACRILKQKGFACRNLSGGYKTYCMAGLVAG